jgi:hypothetical protein
LALFLLDLIIMITRLLPYLMLALCVGPLRVAAQDAPRFLLGANATVAHPMGEMYARMPTQWGVGFGINVLGRPQRELPVLLGVDFSYSIYGRYTERLPPPSWEETLEQVINHNIIMTHIVLRLSPLDNISPIRPYVEGLVGGKFFYTRWKLNSTIGGETVVVDSNTDEASAAFSYGFAGGLNIALGRHAVLDMGCGYLMGHTTTYVERALRQPDGSILYQRGKTRTDMLVPQLGVQFAF